MKLFKKETCFVCSGKLGDNYAIVKYRYQEESDSNVVKLAQEKICDSCMNDIEKESQDDFSV
tara:strand:- start:1359 stop:1544 length:186 start_codon:yes stop_codon:yes gene_type:complete